jgi:hypothetical protein
LRPTSAEPLSTSCNGTSACGSGRHSAGSDETCSVATCSSGDAGPRRTSLAGIKRTDEGTGDRPSSPGGQPGELRQVKTGHCNRSPAASARAIGGQSRAVFLRLG